MWVICIAFTEQHCAQDKKYFNSWTLKPVSPSTQWIWSKPIVWEIRATILFHRGLIFNRALLAVGSVRRNSTQRQFGLLYSGMPKHLAISLSQNNSWLGGYAWEVISEQHDALIDGTMAVLLYSSVFWLFQSNYFGQRDMRTGIVVRMTTALGGGALRLWRGCWEEIAVRCLYRESKNC